MIDKEILIKASKENRLWFSVISNKGDPNITCVHCGKPASCLISIGSIDELGETICNGRPVYIVGSTCLKLLIKEIGGNWRNWEKR